MRWLFAAATLMLVSAPAQAEVIVKDYNEKIRNTDDDVVKGVFRAYLNGAHDGITSMNAYVELNRGIEVICLPPKLAIARDQTVSILNNYIDANYDRIKDATVGIALIYAYRSVFPCK